MFVKNYIKKEENSKLMVLFPFLFEKDKNLKIKKEHNIKPEDIEVLLDGNRYCFNEISEEFKERDYIYTYIIVLIKSYLYTKLYSGSDTKVEPYYKLNNKIDTHFKEKSNEGCHACLCSKGYYHSVSSGFPVSSNIIIKCPNYGKKNGLNKGI